MMSKFIPYVPLANLCVSSVCLCLQLKNIRNGDIDSAVQGMNMKNIYNVIKDIKEDIRDYEHSINTNLTNIYKHVLVTRLIWEENYKEKENDKENN